jgi:hypothetical protein
MRLKDFNPIQLKTCSVSTCDDYPKRSASAVRNHNKFHFFCENKGTQADLFCFPYVYALPQGLDGTLIDEVIGNTTDKSIVWLVDFVAGMTLVFQLLSIVGANMV